jgi:hypothetical protein
MKKIFLTLALAAGVTSFSHAQGVKLGVKGGINLSNLSGDDVEDSALRIGPLGWGNFQPGNQ